MRRVCRRKKPQTFKVQERKGRPKKMEEEVPMGGGNRGVWCERNQRKRLFQARGIIQHAGETRVGN